MTPDIGCLILRHIRGKPAFRRKGREGRKGKAKPKTQNPAVSSQHSAMKQNRTVAMNQGPDLPFAIIQGKLHYWNHHDRMILFHG